MPAKSAESTNCYSKRSGFFSHTLYKVITVDDYGYIGIASVKKRYFCDSLIIIDIIKYLKKIVLLLFLGKFIEILYIISFSYQERYSLNDEKFKTTIFFLSSSSSSRN